MKKRALAEALSAKFSDGEMIVVENLVLERPKTKAIVEVIRNLGLDGKSVLLVLPKKDENILRSARNIPAVSVARVTDLNPYQIVAHDRIVMTEDAVNAITAEVSEQ
jgi:large subunit ribosomal protein L4